MWAGLVLLLGFVAWSVAGPSRFGGPATYLTTDGTSMEPRFHTGDLAIIRRADSYDTGDIVAYYLTSRSIVMHRIVGRDGERFIMKGDNNSWRDATHPGPSQVAGKLWIHIPSAGRALALLHTPGALAALIAIVGMAMMWGKNERPAAGRKQGRRTMNERSNIPRLSGMLTASDMLAIVTAIAIAGLVLAVIAFNRPLYRPGAAHDAYQQTGAFSYSSLAPGDLYAGNRVNSGDPVFLTLVRNLDVGFDYQFSSTSPHDVHGTYKLGVEIRQESGWKRTIDLLPETAFRGDRVTMASVVPLMTVQALAAAFANQTGMKGGNFTVALVPVIKLQGTVAGAPLDAAFTPRMPFRMDPFQLVPDVTGEVPDPLHSSQMGDVSRPRQEMNTFSVARAIVPRGLRPSLRGDRAAFGRWRRCPARSRRNVLCARR